MIVVLVIIVGPQKVVRGAPLAETASQNSVQSPLKEPGDNHEVHQGPIISYGRVYGQVTQLCSSLLLLTAGDEGACAQGPALMHFGTLQSFV